MKRQARIFISHSVSGDPQRPEAFRDGAGAVQELSGLITRLDEAGYRLFEYKTTAGLAESDYRDPDRRDLLHMMYRQLELADALLLVTARDSYQAPGWMIPELFHARALGLKIFHCFLGSAANPVLGDACYADRFQSLQGGIAVSNPRDAVERIAVWADGLPAEAPADALSCADQLLSWDTRLAKQFCDRLVEWRRAEQTGFLSSAAVFGVQWDVPAGWLIRRVYGWLQDSGILVQLAPAGPADHRLPILHFSGATGERRNAFWLHLPLGHVLRSAGPDEDGTMLLLLAGPDGTLSVCAVDGDVAGPPVPLANTRTSVSISQIELGCCWIGANRVRIRRSTGTAEPAPVGAKAEARPFVWMEPPDPGGNKAGFVDLSPMVLGNRQRKTSPWTILPGEFAAMVGEEGIGQVAGPVAAVAKFRLRIGRVDRAKCGLRQQMSPYVRHIDTLDFASLRWPVAPEEVLAVFNDVFGLAGENRLPQIRSKHGEASTGAEGLYGSQGRGGSLAGQRFEISEAQAAQAMRGALGEWVHTPSMLIGLPPPPASSPPG